MGIAPVGFMNFAAPQETYAHAGLENAQTGLVGQEAKTAEMNNQIQRASMPMIMEAMSDAYADQSKANAGTPRAETADRSGVATSDSSDSKWDQRHGSIEETYRNNNYVEPVTQQEQAMLRYGTALSMSPNNAAAGKAIVDRMQTQRQMRIDQQTAQNQRRSGNIYDSAAAVHSIDPNGDTPGATLRALEATDAPDAAAIRKEATGSDGKLDVEKADDMAREHAGHIAAVSHLYSGRPTHDKDGQLVDDRTDQPVVGQKHLYTGSTGDQLAADRQYWGAEIDVPLTSGGSIKMPRGKAPAEYNGLGVPAGSLTPDQYAAQQDRARRNLPPDQRTDKGGPPVPAAQVQANQRAQNPPIAKTPASQAAAATTKAAVDQTPEPAAQYGTAPPVGTPEHAQRMKVALAAAKPAQYGPQATQTRIGFPVAGQAEGIKLFQTQQKELREYGSELATTADQSLQNFNAAKRLLAGDTTLPVTGMIGAALQKASATLGVADTNSARVRQEAAKYLVQGAVSGLKETYGSRPGVFDVKINVEKAFPSLENMGIDEVRNLVDSQITQAQYLKDTAQRASLYAGRNYEPGDFKTWNSRFFPRANIVNPKSKYTDEQVAEYGRVHADALKSAGVTARQHLGME